MPVAPQSISACVGISWLFTVNVQVITKCFPSIDHSNTSTLLTDKCEIPKHLKPSQTQLLLSTEEPSFFNWPNLFPIPQNLSRFLLPLPPLQPPYTSELSFSPHILLPCGWTHHDTNTFHPHTILHGLLQKSFSCLSWGPSAPVWYIPQVMQQEPLQDPLGVLAVLGRWQNLPLPDSVPPSRLVSGGSDYHGSCKQLQTQEVHPAYG